MLDPQRLHSVTGLGAARSKVSRLSHADNLPPQVPPPCRALRKAQPRAASRHPTAKRPKAAPSAAQLEQAEALEELRGELREAELKIDGLAAKSAAAGAADRPPGAVQRATAGAEDELRRLLANGAVEAGGDCGGEAEGPCRRLAACSCSSEGAPRAEWSRRPAGAGCWMLGCPNIGPTRSRSTHPGFIPGRPSGRLLCVFLAPLRLCVIGGVEVDWRPETRREPVGGRDHTANRLPSLMTGS